MFFEVRLEGAIVLAPVVAHFALVRLLARVYPHVSLECLAVAGAVGTGVAAVGFLASVRPHVFGEVASPVESFSALRTHKPHGRLTWHLGLVHCALVLLVLLVHNFTLLPSLLKQNFTGMSQ